MANHGGVIAAGDQGTAAAGAAILEQGGNAVDAAVAAAFASFIAEVGVVHLGGSGIAQIFDPQHGGAITYDFFSNMPGLGSDKAIEALDFKKVTINFGPTTQDFYLGRGSVAVPGNIFGLCRMATDHGRLPLSVSLQPAINMAREGISLSPFQADTCDLLRPLYTHTAGMRTVFQKNGKLIQPYEHLYIPDLAETLEQLAAEGSSYARNGHLAQAILADQEANGGLLTAEDLTSFQVVQMPPIRIHYRDYEILLPPPSSSGGVLTAFTLKLISHFDLASMPHGSTRYMRLLYEAMSATTRARPVWDKSIEEKTAEEAIGYFLSDTFVSHFLVEVKAAVEGEESFPTLTEPTYHPDTSHLSVIDGDGLAVSLTTTAGESAGYIVPGTGYIPNNILGEADLHPNGFHSSPAGQRIGTMMTPTIVLKDGRIRLVVGSGGSIRIRSAILQVLTNLLDYHMTLDSAVNTSRVHVEEGILQCEAGYDSAAVDRLEELGYEVNRWDKRSIYFGGAHSVSWSEDGRLVAAGDNRRGGSVARAGGNGG
jgi:gamma-glutamyltranspeptidase/glutathione hydrolase